jgi:hypothetical protein
MPVDCPDCQKLAAIVNGQEAQIRSDASKMQQASDLIDDMAKQITEQSLEIDRLNGMFMSMRDVSMRIQKR